MAFQVIHFSRIEKPGRFILQAGDLKKDLIVEEF